MNSFINSIRRDYFSLHVFFISSSCLFDASHSTRFVWKSSDTPALEFETAINLHKPVTFDHSTLTNGVWVDDHVIQFSKESTLQFNLDWNVFYQLSFDVIVPSTVKDNSGLCVILQNLAIVIPVSTRPGITMTPLTHSPCSVTSSSIALFIQSHSISVIRYSTSSAYPYTQYQIPLRQSLFDGKMHRLELNYNLLYQYMSVDMDSQRVFKHEDFIRLTSTVKTVLFQSTIQVSFIIHLK